MLHAKFRGNRTTDTRENVLLRVFTIYGHGGHLGHVTSIKSTKACIKNWFKAS